MFDDCGFLFENELGLRFEGSNGNHGYFGFECNNFRLRLTPEKGIRGRLLIWDWKGRIEHQICDFSLDEWETFQPGVISRREYILKKFNEAFDKLPTKWEDDVRGWAIGGIEEGLDDLFELLEKDE